MGNRAKWQEIGHGLFFLAESILPEYPGVLYKERFPMWTTILWKTKRVRKGALGILSESVPLLALKNNGAHLYASIFPGDVLETPSFWMTPSLWLKYTEFRKPTNITWMIWVNNPRNEWLRLTNAGHADPRLGWSRALITLGGTSLDGEVVWNMGLLLNPGYTYIVCDYGIFLSVRMRRW